MADKPAEVTEQTATPAEVTAAPAETAVSEAAPDAHSEPTLLESFVAENSTDKPAEVAEGGDQVAEVKAEEVAAEKPAEKPADKPEDKPEAKDAKPEDKLAEDKPAEAAKPEPIDYKYTVPENIKLDDATKAEFHTALDTYRADPTNPQPLMDLYNAQMTKYAEHIQREQHRVFGETRKTWAEAVKADPILGGAGYQTAMKAVARMRDQFVSRHAVGSDDHAKDLKSFDTMLRVTGAGDHPAMMHFMHNIAQFADEPAVRHGDINPPADIGKGPKGGAKVLYDHPRSPGNRK